MDGGDELGRRLSFLDSAAIKEEEEEDKERKRRTTNPVRIE